MDFSVSSKKLFDTLRHRVESFPFSAAATISSRASSKLFPESMAPLRASTAGSKVSTRVLSPTLAFLSD